MAFTLPSFNLVCKYWLPPHVPHTDPADGTVDCQMYVLNRLDIDITPGSSYVWVPPVVFRIPVLSFTAIAPAAGVILKVIDPLTAHQWCYLVRWWDAIHIGFPNQYYVLVSEQCDDLGNTPDAGRVHP